MKSPTSPVIIPLEKNYPVLRIADKPAIFNWKKLAITTTDEVRFIPHDAIIYCMSNSNYTTIFLHGGRSYFCSRTLKDIQAKLPQESFFRVHHSYLVNLHCINSLKKKTGEIEIENKLLVPIGRMQKQALYEMLGL